MPEETLVQLLERRFVTADGVIVWNEQVKGLIESEINKAHKNATYTGVSKSVCDHADENGYVARSVCIKCGKRMPDF